MIKRIIIAGLMLGLFYVLGGCAKSVSETQLDAAETENHNAWGTLPDQKQQDANNASEWKTSGEVGKIPTDTTDPWNRVQK